MLEPQSLISDRVSGYHYGLLTCESCKVKIFEQLIKKTPPLPDLKVTTTKRGMSVGTRSEFVKFKVNIMKVVFKVIRKGK